MMYAKRILKRKTGLPLGFSQTVTVFNAVINTDENGKTYSAWQATVIQNCFYGDTAARSFRDKAEILAYKTVCKIPPDTRYLPPEQFETLSEDRKSEYFTLRPDDMIFKGAVSTPDKQAHDGNFFIIKRAKDLTDGGILPHYRAEGD